MSMESAPPITINRTGTREFVAENAAGSQVSLGNGPGQFTPGELLLIALAGCQVMSADATIAHAVADQFPGRAVVTRKKDEPGNRYTGIDVQYQVGANLSEAQVASLLRMAAKAVDRNCTVGRSIDHGLEHSLTISFGEDS